MRVGGPKKWGASVLFLVVVACVQKQQDVKRSAPVTRPHVEVQPARREQAAAIQQPAPVNAPLVRKVRLAIILCKFLDKPAEIRPRRFYEDYYTRLSTGGLADYWKDVTLGTVDLSDSEVFGWYTMSHNSKEVAQLVFPGGRRTLVEWGRDAAARQGIDLSKYDGVIVVQNWGVDHGDAGNGVIIVDQNIALLESTFIAHEMGHLFGLPHSFGEDTSACGHANGEYCDPWDMMSAMNVYSYSDSFQGVSGTFGPGLNVFASRALGALRGERLLTLSKPGFSDTLQLAPLNQPVQTGSLYAVEIRSERPSILPYTIEYRHKAGWDRGLPADAVLIHEEKNLRSYLKRILLAGDHYSTPTSTVELVSIDPVSLKATVRIWTN